MLSTYLRSCFASSSFVLTLLQLNLFTLGENQLSAIVEDNENEDMLTIQVDEQSAEIFSGSLRGLLRAMCSSHDNEDYHTTFLMVYDYFISHENLLRVRPSLSLWTSLSPNVQTIILFYRSPLITLTVRDIPEDSGRSMCDHCTDSSRLTSSYQARLIEFVNLWITLRFDILQVLLPLSLCRPSHCTASRWLVSIVHDICELPCRWRRRSSACHCADSYMARVRVTVELLSRETRCALSCLLLTAHPSQSLMIRTPFGPPNTVQFLFISAQQMAEQLTLREQSYFQVLLPFLRSLPDVCVRWWRCENTTEKLGRWAKRQLRISPRSSRGTSWQLIVSFPLSSPSLGLLTCRTGLLRRSSKLTTWMVRLPTSIVPKPSRASSTP